MAMTGLSDVVGRVIDGEAVPSGSSSRWPMPRLATQRERLGGHIRTTWDLELIQVCSDGAVVYADGLGDGSQRSACPVLRSDDGDVNGASRRCTDRRPGFESRPASSEAGRSAAVVTAVAIRGLRFWKRLGSAKTLSTRWLRCSGGFESRPIRSAALADVLRL